MVRRIGCLLAVAAATLAAAPQALAVPPHRADGNLSDWVGDPTSLSGTSRISRGELIYDDWLYDDYGADLDQATNPPAFRSYLAPTQGDYRYPTDSARYGYNAADLRELRVAADSRGLHLLVYLQTMKASNAAAVTVAIDGPRDRSRSIAWPDGIGLTAPAADRYITFWGTGGWVTDFRGRRTPIRTQGVNLSENAIEVDVPWSDLGDIATRSVRMWVASGLFDPQAGRYMTVGTGQATLVVKAKGKKRRKLNTTGKVKLNVAITFTPTGGKANIQSLKVKLKKKLKK